MNRGAAFRQGIRAAIPVYLGFFSVTLAIGIAAQAAGLSLLEILWMSAAVFAAPAQFAAIELLPGGGHTGQILLSTLFINLRFAVMGMALAPYFRSVGRRSLLLGVQLISISTFALSFLRFQRREDIDHFSFFLGVAIPSFICYLLGTTVGYVLGFGLPEGFEEGVGFLFPAYLAGILATELRERRPILLVLAAFATTPLAEALLPGWGLVVNGIVVGTAAVGVEAWMDSVS